MEDDHDPHMDLAPLRIAMEHMIYRQQMELDRAALLFVLYALGLVQDNLGTQRMQSIIDQARDELSRQTRPADTSLN